MAFGGIVTVTQVSDASTKQSTQRALAACDNLQAPKSSEAVDQDQQGTYTTNNGKVTQHADDGAGDVPTTAQMRSRCRQWVMQNAGNNTGGGNNGGNSNGGAASSGPRQRRHQAPARAATTTAATRGGNNNGGNNGGNNNGGRTTAVTTTAANNGGAATPPPGAGLGVLANSCDNSQLEPHDGFQNGNRCVSTEFGEVGSAANNPSLLITEAPEQVGVNQAVHASRSAPAT